MLKRLLNKNPYLHNSLTQPVTSPGPQGKRQSFLNTNEQKTAVASNPTPMTITICNVSASFSTEIMFPEIIKVFQGP